MGSSPTRRARDRPPGNGLRSQAIPRSLAAGRDTSLACVGQDRGALDRALDSVGGGSRCRPKAAELRSPTSSAGCGSPGRQCRPTGAASTFDSSGEASWSWRGTVAWAGGCLGSAHCSPRAPGLGRPGTSRQCASCVPSGAASRSGTGCRESGSRCRGPTDSSRSRPALLSPAPPRTRPACRSGTPRTPRRGRRPEGRRRNFRHRSLLHRVTSTSSRRDRSPAFCCVLRRSSRGKGTYLRARRLRPGGGERKHR